STIASASRRSGWASRCRRVSSARPSGRASRSSVAGNVMPKERTATNVPPTSRRSVTADGWERMFSVPFGPSRASELGRSDRDGPRDGRGHLPAIHVAALDVIPQPTSAYLIGVVDREPTRTELPEGCDLLGPVQARTLRIHDGAVPGR